MNDNTKKARELLDRLKKVQRNGYGHRCDARASIDSAVSLLPELIAALSEKEHAGQVPVAEVKFNGTQYYVDWLAGPSAIVELAGNKLYATPQPASAVPEDVLRDADRLDWLSENGYAVRRKDNGARNLILWVDEGRGLGWHPKTLREAIDAAMLAAAKGGGDAQ